MHAATTNLTICVLLGMNLTVEDGLMSAGWHTLTR